MYSHVAIYYTHSLDRTFHALGDATRRGMLALLAKRGECIAGELGAPFDISQPTASRHLRVLESAGLITRRVEGRVHTFRLAVKPLEQAERWISRHRQFWEGSLDRLGGYLDEVARKRERDG